MERKKQEKETERLNKVRRASISDTISMSINVCFYYYKKVLEFTSGDPMCVKL